MSASGATHWKDQIREERIARSWRQQDIADRLGTTVLSVKRWERGSHQPSQYFRAKLCTLFGKSMEELSFVPASKPVPEHPSEAEMEKPPEVPFLPFTASTLWNVPYPRNSLFTGREEILSHLHKQLHREHTMALTQSWAVTGLGGIGKTQIALEYAYRYRQDYHFVFWANAATHESLLVDIVAIAEGLQLPACNKSDQKKILLAVKQWLVTHQNWLWILDNADDITILQDVIPAERQGHILLTTRAQALGMLAQRVEVEIMGLAEGTLFLLHRAKILAADLFLDCAREDHLAAAEAIVLEMDFLPLALDQAGAYIEEVGCGLSTYLELYRMHRKELLHRRGHLSTDHPESVATTWSLSFQKVEQANPAAADLLRFYAFLEPDSIPEELISEGGAHLGPILAPVALDALRLNDAMEELRRFSLIQRNADTKMVRIHRLVQSVLKDAMDAEVQRQWAQRTIYAVNTAFPQHIDMPTWTLCRRYLAQAQSCSILGQDYTFTFEQMASLLFRTATYLQEHALYEQAELLYQQAIHISEQTPGMEHLELARSLNGLGNLYEKQKKYQQAEPLYQRAIRIMEHTLGREHLEVARPLNGLGNLYKNQGKYTQAERLYQRAIRIREQVLGAEHADLLLPLNGLANLYNDQGKKEQAACCYQRALQIGEQTLEPGHPKIALVLNNLALLYSEQGKYEQAESLFQRALHMQEQAQGSEHPELARSLSNLAQLYSEQGKYEQAEPLLRRAVRIREQALGPDHPDLLFSLRNLAHLASEQGQYEQAEQLCQRAIENVQKALGPDYPGLALVFDELATIYARQGKGGQAEALYQQAIQIQEQVRGRDHSYVSYPLRGLANLYREQGKDAQAEPVYQRTLQIQERALGCEHPDTAETLHDLAVFREAQGRSQEAAPLCQRALMIREKILGPTHPKTLATRTLYTRLVQRQPGAQKNLLMSEK